MFTLLDDSVRHAYTRLKNKYEHPMNMKLQNVYGQNELFDIVLCIFFLMLIPGNYITRYRYCFLKAVNTSVFLRCMNFLMDLSDILSEYLNIQYHFHEMIH